MFWFAFAAMAIQGAGQKAGAEAAAITEKSNAKIQNITREANNKLAAVRGSLSRYQTSVKNRQLLKDLGKEFGAAQTNLLRVQESLSEGSVDRRIQAAEAGGALAARIAASGVGGGTVDMLNSTNNLRTARIEQLSQRRADQQMSDMTESRDRIFDSMVLGLDFPQIADGLNVAQVIPRHVNVPSWGQILATSALKAYAETGGEGLGFGNRSSSTPTVDFVGFRDQEPETIKSFSGGRPQTYGTPFEPVTFGFAKDFA